jgi:hypothetical protein
VLTVRLPAYPTVDVCLCLDVSGTDVSGTQSLNAFVHHIKAIRYGVAFHPRANCFHKMGYWFIVLGIWYIALLCLRGHVDTNSNDAHRRQVKGTTKDDTLSFGKVGLHTQLLDIRRLHKSIT